MPHPSIYPSSFHASGHAVPPRAPPAPPEKSSNVLQMYYTSDILHPIPLSINRKSMYVQFLAGPHHMNFRLLNAHRCVWRPSVV